MSNQKIIELLKKDNKGVTDTFGVTGVLSRLFRQILSDLNIKPQDYNSLLVSYVRDIRNRIPNNRKDIAIAMGNISKELLRPNMSWKVFCKGMRFLRFTKFEIIIRCHSENKTYSDHSVVVDLSNTDFNKED